MASGLSYGPPSGVGAPRDRWQPHRPRPGLRAPVIQDASVAARLVALGTAESMRLLAEVPLGRVVFSDRALPAIRPVNHVVHDGDIVIRTHPGAALLNRAASSAVVAYEADELDPVTRTGWSVIVTGTASRVREPAELSCLQDLLASWIDLDVGEVVRIRPEIVTGYRLVREAGELPDGAGELPGGAGELPNGAGDLPGGAGDLPDGAGELPDASGPPGAAGYAD